MKRLTFCLFPLLFGLLSLSTVVAYNTEIDGLHRLAEYMPDTIEMFMAMEISDDFFSDLDAIMNKIYDSVPSFIPNERLTFTEALEQALVESNIDWNDLQSLLGDYVGVGGIYGDEIEDEDSINFWLVVEIVDQKAINEIILEQSIMKLPKPSIDGDTISYELDEYRVTITPSKLIITSDDADIYNLEPLSKSEEFITSLNTLQEDRYSVLLYISKLFVQKSLASSGDVSYEEYALSLDGLGAMSLGFTLLNADTVAIDLSLQTVTPMITPAVNMNVVSNLPASTDVFVVATDIGNLYKLLIDMMQTNSEFNDTPDPTPMLNLFLNYGRFDFEEDFLSWVTGTYVAFAGFDVKAVVQDVSRNENISNLDDIMFGIVFEATDPSRVSNFIEKVADVSDVFALSLDDLVIKEFALDGELALSIFLELPMDSTPATVRLQLVMVAMDEFLYFGTVNGYEEIVAGNVLVTNPDFRLGMPHVLDNSTTISYLNSDLMMLSLVLSMPMANDVFDRILSELEATPSNRSTESPPLEIYLVAFDWINDLISNVTFSTSVNEEGVMLMRFVVGYGE